MNGNARDVRPVFAIFEGGGAKGIAHVGALAAAEDNNLQLIGVAGASAGAIVAALVAVGYAAHELLDPSDISNNIISRHGETPTGLLGRDDWRLLRQMQREGACVAQRLLVLGGLLTFPTALSISRAALRAWSRKGHLSTDRLREFLNEVLRNRIAELWAAAGLEQAAPERVLFEHLDYETYPEIFRPLKVVASDVTNRQLKIFDKRLTPKVEVAQAVSASVAIPTVFVPVTIEDDGRSVRYVDGGLVSNLPIWIFSEEKLAFERSAPDLPPVPIIGFSLDNKSERARNDGTPDYLWDVVETALAAGQSVSRNFVQDLVIAPLKTDLDLLDFDAGEAAMLAAYSDGYECADRALRHSLMVKPDRVRAELRRLHTRLKRRINRVRRARRQAPVRLLRANVVERFGVDSFRVTHAYNMDRDADDRLALDARGRAAPRAFQSRTMEHAPVGSAWSRPDGDYMTKYERALVRRSIRSIISVPIFASEDAWELPPEERPQPQGVVSFDSNQDLAIAFDDDDIRYLLATQSTLLYPILVSEPDSGEAQA